MNKVRKALPSVVYLLIAAVFYWQTFLIHKTDNIGIVSATTIPRVIILMLAACAVLNLVHDLKQDGEVARYINIPWKFLVTGLLLFFAAQYCKKIGFVIIGSVFLGVLFNLLDEEAHTPKRVILQILLAVVLAFAISYGFRYGLKVRLPLWPKL